MQVVAVQLLDDDAASAVQLVMVGPVVTGLQVVVVWVTGSVPGVQDATGVVARMVVMSQVVAV